MRFVVPLRFRADGPACASGWLDWRRSTAGLALALLGSCAERPRVEGEVFISGVKDAAGKIIGVAIDFVPTRPDADLGQVKLDIQVSKASLMVDGRGVSSTCRALPSSGRLTLASASGELTSDARVTVVARRAASLVLGRVPSADTITGGAAGTAGASSAGADAAAPAGSCAGEPIDDALWPNVGASVPPPPASGGASQGGSGGSSPTAGVSGDGGAEPGGMGPEGGGSDGGLGGAANEAGSGGVGTAGAVTGGTSSGSGADAGSSGADAGASSGIGGTS